MTSIGILASGAGTTAQALLDACAAGTIPARVAVLVCNVPGAKALERARTAGVPAIAIPHRDFPTREAFDAAVLQALRRHGVELLVLAGFMRLLGPAFVRGFRHRLINVHPSILPAFPGVAAPRQAIDHAVRLSGCTVHFVDEGTDTGPVIAQAAVPVLDDDTPESLHGRIQLEERRLLTWAVGLFAQGRLEVMGRRVRIRPAPGAAVPAVPPALRWPEPA